MITGIYKIENLINHKIYIGQSLYIEKRWHDHLFAKDDFAIHQAFKKYGIQNFTFQILEECSVEELDEKEIYWINFYQSLVPNGYNMVEGGTNGAGYSKGKKVLQFDLQGKFIKEYPSALQASQITGIAHTQICKCCRGIIQQSGTYQWKYADDTKKILPIIKRTDFTVIQLDKETEEIIEEYNSIAEASRITGIAKATICNVCNGKGKTAGGYIWKYKIDGK